MSKTTKQTTQSVADERRCRSLRRLARPPRTMLERARDAVNNILRNGRLCPNDTDGDGDCGHPMCHVCGEGRRPNNKTLATGGAPPMTTELETRMTGAPPVGISAWLGRISNDLQTIEK